jgi:hypothetical protein
LFCTVGGKIAKPQDNNQHNVIDKESREESKARYRQTYDHPRHIDTSSVDIVVFVVVVGVDQMLDGRDDSDWNTTGTD